MQMRPSYRLRPVIALLAAIMTMVALACGGEAATPTSPPPTATTKPAVAAPTATAVPATATPVPEGAIYDDLAHLTSLPGYDPAWGEPKYGGVVRLSGPDTSVDMGPFINMGWGPYNVSGYNTLIKNDPWQPQSKGYKPELAESWEMSADGLHFTFNLREGVLFHGKDSPNGLWSIPLGGVGHGTELHCDDVKASLEFYAHPPEAAQQRYGSYARSLYGHIESVTCPDGPEGYTAVMNLDRVRATSLGSMAKGRGAPIQNAEYWEWIWSSEYHFGGRSERMESQLGKMGTGAFMPDIHEADVMTGARANPNYFKPGLPLLDRLEGYSIPDATTRYSAWVTGKTNMFGGGSSGLTPALVEQTQKSHPDYEIFPTLYQLQGVHLNTQIPPFDDQRVRSAAHLAMDREVWREMKKSGTMEGTILASVVPPFSYFGHSIEELEEWPGFRQPKDVDIAEANRLMDEVYGAGERPSMNCLTRTVATYTDYCIFFVEQMQRNLGVQMTMEVLDGSAAGKKRTSCEYTIDADSAFDVNTTSDPHPRLYGFGHSEQSGRACMMVSNNPDDVAEMNARIEEQEVELDPVKRRELVRGIDKDLTLTWIPYVIEGHVVTFLGFRPETNGGIFFFEGGQTKGWALYERMWMD